MQKYSVALSVPRNYHMSVNMKSFNLQSTLENPSLNGWPGIAAAGKNTLTQNSGFVSSTCYCIFRFFIVSEYMEIPTAKDSFIISQFAFSE